MGVQPKKSSRLFILLGVVLTLLSMGGVYFIAKSSSKSAVVGTSQVLVATREIPMHTTFSSVADVQTWFTPTSVTTASSPLGAFTDATSFAKLEFVGGKVATTETIYPKEIVLPSMLTGIGSRANYDVTSQLPKNDVAVSLEASTVNESGGAIQAGDSVDLIASYLPTGGGGGSGASEVLPNKNRTQTQYVLQDLKVLALGTWVAGDTATATTSSTGGSTMLTFAVDHKTALVIQHLKDFGGSWDLSVVLRSLASHKTYKTTPVDGAYFFSHLRDNFVQ
jgi:Flp pilus assembly protein CpaB